MSRQILGVPRDFPEKSFKKVTFKKKLFMLIRAPCDIKKLVMSIRAPLSSNQRMLGGIFAQIFREF